MRKRGILVSALVLVLLAGCGQSRETAEETQQTSYPLEAVELIAPAGKGSGYDLTLRSMAQCLSSVGLVSVPLPVTNKPGGGGSISLEYLEESRGRDNVVAIFSPPICLIHLNGNTQLNYEDNTTPIARMVVDYGCLAVKADSPYEDLNQLIDQLKIAPETVRVGGTSSYGSLDHIQFLKIAQAGGVEHLEKIPYEGFENGGAVAQLMGGRVDVLALGISDVVGLVESGDIRVLAVTSEERLDGQLISQFPTCMEQGIDAEFMTWRGLFGPADMPEYAVSYWEETLKELTATREWETVCKKYGWSMGYQNREEFKEFLDQTNEEYRTLLEEIGLENE